LHLGHVIKERIVDVVEEGRRSKLGLNWRIRLTVPFDKNSKHLAYLTSVTISGIQGETKRNEGS
jgi:hypothetical protein